MKAIILPALFALAAKALNPQDYIDGFSQQLGLTQTDVQDGFNCVAGLQNAVVQVIQLIQGNHNDFATLLFQAERIVQELQESITTECEPLVGDVVNVVERNLEGRDLEESIKVNLQRYFPELVQKVAQWVQLVAQGQDEKAGQTDAYILQVLLGSQQPETLPVPKATKYAPFDEEKFLSEYYTAFYNTLGLEVDVADLSKCVEGVQSLAVSAVTLVNELPSLGLDGKITAVRDFVDVAAEELRSCEGTIEVQKEILLRVLSAAEDNILGYTLQTVGNLALNLPEFIQLKEKAIVEMTEGEYILAGEYDAQSVQLIDGGRVFPQ